MEVWIQAESDEDRLRAETLAAQLGVPIVCAQHANTNNKVVSDEYSLLLHVSVLEGLSLSAPKVDRKARVSISFCEGALNHRRLYGGGRSQSIAKAIGLQRGASIQVVDATGGLGGDSYTLSALGATVTCLERSPLLSLMLKDARARAVEFVESRDDPELKNTLDRLNFIEAESMEWLSSTEQEGPEVIYLDPMFPERKKSASVKKEMQILQVLLEGDEQQDEQLLDIALQRATHRVVVKRPRHAPPITGPAPQYHLEGKTTRFDIYPLKSLKH